MTQYIADMLRSIKQQLDNLQKSVEEIISSIPKDAEYAYIDNSRGSITEESDSTLSISDNTDGE